MTRASCSLFTVPLLPGRARSLRTASGSHRNRSPTCSLVTVIPPLPSLLPGHLPVRLGGTAARGLELMPDLLEGLLAPLQLSPLGLGLDLALAIPLLRFLGLDAVPLLEPLGLRGASRLQVPRHRLVRLGLLTL